MQSRLLPQEAPATGLAQPPFAPGAKIAVVVVNWNGYRDTVECLASLRAAHRRPRRVIVVDNASRDGSIGALTEWAGRAGVSYEVVSGAARAKSTWLTIVSSATNLGFAGGNNLGLAHAAADPAVTHFLLLNNDAAVEPDYFAELAKGCAAHPHAGLLSGTILEAAAPHRVWYAGGAARPLRALMLHRRDVPADGEPRETEFISGCTMLIPRSTYESAGPLPECYFPGYWEDAEYCARVQALGRPLIYVPRARATHKVGSSFGSGASSPWVARVQNRHRVLYVKRNMRGPRRIAALAYLIATKPARGALEALRGRVELGAAIVSGMFAGLLDRGARRPDPDAPRATPGAAGEAVAAQRAD